MKITRVLIVGFGVFGSALAHALAKRADLYIEVYSRRSNIAGCQFFIASEERVNDANYDLVLLCLESSGYRQVLERFSARFATIPIISCAKGMDPKKIQFLSQTIFELTKNDHIGVLCGPSFSSEILSGLPLKMTLACQNGTIANYISQILTTPTMIVQACTDLRGVEFSSVAKNVLAVGAGLSEGLGLGLNFRAMYIARGVIEVHRILKYIGGDPASAIEVGPLGDIVLSCTSNNSRNYSAGISLAKGEVLSEKLAEGLNSIDLLRKFLDDRMIDSDYFSIIFESCSNPEKFSDILLV